MIYKKCPNYRNYRIGDGERKERPGEGKQTLDA